MLTVNLQPFPVLSTGRLILRRVDKKDAPEVFAMRSSPEVMKYIDRLRATSMDDALDFIQRVDDLVDNNNGITWAITLKDDDTMIGSIGLWRIVKEHYRAEIGYMMQPSFQGKGLMNEAMIATLDYGFKELKLHSVEANVNPANAASARILEKHGFVREAYFKENFYFNGKFLDTFIFSLLAPKID
jgi:ribosomal-protein-alanine N-acetyltransferase